MQIDVFKSSPKQYTSESNDVIVSVAETRHIITRIVKQKKDALVRPQSLLEKIDREK